MCKSAILLLMLTNTQSVCVDENTQLVMSPPSLTSATEQCAVAPDCRVLRNMAYHESRGESDKGVKAVMHVAINRKEHEKWPHTLYGVVHQPHQFSYLWDGSAKQKMDEKQVERISHIAISVIQCRQAGTECDFTKGSTHYHSDSVSPHWRSKLTQTAKIGRHIFYK